MVKLLYIQCIFCFAVVRWSPGDVGVLILFFFFLILNFFSFIVLHRKTSRTMSHYVWGTSMNLKLNFKNP